MSERLAPTTTPDTKFFWDALKEELHRPPRSDPRRANDHAARSSRIAEVIRVFVQPSTNR
jgi:hypothetical protein